MIDSDKNESSPGHIEEADVCSRPLGNTAQGLCDMAGNAWEWVEYDWHDSYIGAPSEDQLGSIVLVIPVILNVEGLAVTIRRTAVLLYE